MKSEEQIQAEFVALNKERVQKEKHLVACARDIQLSGAMEYNALQVRLLTQRIEVLQWVLDND